MKVLWIISLFFTLSVWADDSQIWVDLDDPAQAALAAGIDSVRALRMADEAQELADQIAGTYVDTTGLDDAGVAVLPDSTDATWVQIGVPLATAEGFEKAFWVGVLEEFVADGAQYVTASRVRTGQQAAIRGLLRLQAVLAQ